VCACRLIIINFIIRENDRPGNVFPGKKTIRETTVNRLSILSTSEHLQSCLLFTQVSVFAVNLSIHGLWIGPENFSQGSWKSPGFFPVKEWEPCKNIAGWYGTHCLCVVWHCSSAKPAPPPPVAAAVTPATKPRGPVNGDECYFWRTTGCQFTTGCRYRHVPEHRGIDKKPWQKSVKWDELPKTSSLIDQLWLEYYIDDVMWKELCIS